jgi:hypothetical protein
MLLFMSIASALVTDWSSTVDPDLLSLVVVAGARVDPQGLLLGVKIAGRVSVAHQVKPRCRTSSGAGQRSRRL